MLVALVGLAQSAWEPLSEHELRACESWQGRGTTPQRPEFDLRVLNSQRFDGLQVSAASSSHFEGSFYDARLYRITSGVRLLHLRAPVSEASDSIDLKLILVEEEGGLRVAAGNLLSPDDGAVRLHFEKRPEQLRVFGEIECGPAATIQFFAACESSVADFAPWRDGPGCGWGWEPRDPRFREPWPVFGLLDSRANFWCRPLLNDLQQWGPPRQLAWSRAELEIAAGLARCLRFTPREESGHCWQSLEKSVLSFPQLSDWNRDALENGLSLEDRTALLAAATRGRTGLASFRVSKPREALFTEIEPSLVETGMALREFFQLTSLQRDGAQLVESLGFIDREAILRDMENMLRAGLEWGPESSAQLCEWAARTRHLAFAELRFASRLAALRNTLAEQFEMAARAHLAAREAEPGSFTEFATACQLGLAWMLLEPLPSLRELPRVAQWRPFNAGELLRIRQRAEAEGLPRLVGELDKLNGQSLESLRVYRSHSQKLSDEIYELRVETLAPGVAMLRVHVEDAQSGSLLAFRFVLAQEAGGLRLVASDMQSDSKPVERSVSISFEPGMNAWHVTGVLDRDFKFFGRLHHEEFNLRELEWWESRSEAFANFPQAHPFDGSWRPHRIKSEPYEPCNASFLKLEKMGVPDVPVWSEDELGVAALLCAPFLDFPRDWLAPRARSLEREILTHSRLCTWNEVAAGTGLSSAQRLELYRSAILLSPLAKRRLRAIGTGLEAELGFELTLRLLERSKFRYPIQREPVLLAIESLAAEARWNPESSARLCWLAASTRHAIFVEPGIMRRLAPLREQLHLAFLRHASDHLAARRQAGLDEAFTSPRASFAAYVTACQLGLAWMMLQPMPTD